MDRTEQEAELMFALPIRQVTFMLLVIVLAAIGSYLAFPRVAPVFLANPYLNGVIVAVFVVGVLATFWQVWQLFQSVAWIKGFAANRPGYEPRKAPRLLASLAALLRTRGARTQIGASSSRTILDSVATRIDEARDITRYIVNLLIFLGLLGTFYGLATTVPAVVDTIRSLAPQEGESSVDIFTRLMGGLEKQLGGMGTAFASSLLGLAGSLIVGLLELFASHGQNRFYRELEDWMSTITRLGFAGGDGEGGGDQAVLVQVLDQMVEQMEGLQRLFIQSDEAHSLSETRLATLTTALERMSDKMDASMDGETRQTAAFERMAEGQERLIAAMQAGATGEHVDAESRMRLRSIDVQLLRILEEMSAGRQESLAELRGDLKALLRVTRNKQQGG
ncbi:MAG: biopolymer transporter ExbB [Brevirhabdus sp.]